MVKTFQRSIFSLALVGLLGLTACAGAPPAEVSAGRPAEQWVTFKDHAEPDPANPPSVGVASLVILRASASTQNAVNVFVNGEYATSLLPGAARKIEVCAGTRQISLAFSDVGRRYKDKEPGAPALQATLSAGQTGFVQILEPVEGAQPTARLVSAEDAARVTDTAKWQSHSLSRISTAACAGSTASGT